MKKFFVIIPHMTNLTDMVYLPVDNDRLAMDMAVSFPILNVVNAYLLPADDWQVFPIMVEGKDKYLERFRVQLETLQKAKGLKAPVITPIFASGDQSVRCQLKLLKELLPCIKDGDQVYACITAGTKVLSNTVSTSLPGICRLRQNATLECMVYGQKDWDENQPGHIYDITALYRMNELMDSLARFPGANPETAVGILLSNLE